MESTFLFFFISRCADDTPVAADAIVESTNFILNFNKILMGYDQNKKSKDFIDEANDQLEQTYNAYMDENSSLGVKIKEGKWILDFYGRFSQIKYSDIKSTFFVSKA